ncbi:MarR family winged helix-turn-helix transcriptional regulator [Corynebacterium lubricantis]|uniref:MarR family winged helix-turn-helix transcriptional regulator n=1 Tax=Corynebacterium lubricantis TaxID=541095 RepID=UPI00047753A7|nr:MarR family transcriptional regulator [Corynebacterium lubricantis]
MSTERVTFLNEKESRTWGNLWSLHVALPAKLDARLKREAGIGHFDFMALREISVSQQGAIRLSELATATDMSLSHLSRVITRLEKNGLVRRIPDAQDGRSTIAELTSEGKKVVETAEPEHTSEIRRIFFDNLDESELHAVDSAMAKIAKALHSDRNA